MNECARNDGFHGIYIVSMNVDHEYIEGVKSVSASVDFEPNRTKYKLLLENTTEAKPKEKVLSGIVMSCERLIMM